MFFVTAYFDNTKVNEEFHHTNLYYNSRVSLRNVVINMLKTNKFLPRNCQRSNKSEVNHYNYISLLLFTFFTHLMQYIIHYYILTLILI